MHLSMVTLADRVISLERAKSHLKVDYSEDDADILTCIDGARGAIERETGYLVGERTVDCVFNGFLGLTLETGPIIEVVSVKYLDPTGETQTLPSSDYRYLKGPRTIVLKPDKSWPDLYNGDECVTVRVRAGWKVGADLTVGETELPSDLLKLMFVLLNHGYENREYVYTGLQLREYPKELGIEQICSGHKRFVS